MGKDDDLIRRAALAAQRPAQAPANLTVASPQNWEQTVAWVAAMIYPDTSYMADSAEKRSDVAVDTAVAIVARAAAAVSSGALRDAAKEEITRLEQQGKANQDGVKLEN